MASSQPQEALHLFRHLLREASYLPPVCRHHIGAHISQKFRQHCHDPAPRDRLRRAAHDLRYLRAANGGDMARMRRVVMTAFGRIGWRRHELMRTLRTRELPASSADLQQQLAQTPARAPPEDWLDRWDTDRLLAFARSQGKHTLHNSPRPLVNTRRLDPAAAVPPLNAWEQPFAPKVARSKLRKWWKSLANRLLPPLPRGEWDLLQKLATGRARAEWLPPPRRAPVADADADAADKAASAHWNWQTYATTPVHVVDRAQSRRARVFAGPGHGDRPANGPAIGVHRYTPRFWRRLYAEVWQMSAKMERQPDNAGGGWAYTWGGLPLQPLPPSAAHRAFFEGVDSKGHVLKLPEDTSSPPALKTQR